MGLFRHMVWNIKETMKNEKEKKTENKTVLEKKAEKLPEKNDK